jgi:hypothetical protein
MQRTWPWSTPCWGFSAVGLRPSALQTSGEDLCGASAPSYTCSSPQPLSSWYPCLSCPLLLSCIPPVLASVVSAPLLLYINSPLHSLLPLRPLHRYRLRRHCTIADTIHTYNHTYIRGGMAHWLDRRFLIPSRDPSAPSHRDPFARL